MCRSSQQPDGPMQTQSPAHTRCCLLTPHTGATITRTPVQVRPCTQRQPSEPIRRQYEQPQQVTWRYSVRGVISGLPATPGCWAVRRPNLTITLLPERPLRYLAAWSPSQPSVDRPSMLSSCTTGPVSGCLVMVHGAGVGCCHRPPHPMLAVARFEQTALRSASSRAAHVHDQLVPGGLG